MPGPAGPGGPGGLAMGAPDAMAPGQGMPLVPPPAAAAAPAPAMPPGGLPGNPGGAPAGVQGPPPNALPLPGQQMGAVGWPKPSRSTVDSHPSEPSLPSGGAQSEALSPRRRPDGAAADPRPRHARPGSGAASGAWPAGGVARVSPDSLEAVADDVAYWIETTSQDVARA